MASTSPLENEFTPVSALQVVLLCILFGANPVAVKISLAGFGPLTTAAIRFAVAAVIIFVWAKVTKRSLTVEKKHRMPIVFIGLILTAQISLFYIGMTQTYATHGAILSNLLPFCILIFAHYFVENDRITARKVIGMLMGFSGVAVVLMDKNGMQPGVKFGDLILLGAVMLWSCRIILTKNTVTDCEPFHTVFYPFVFAAPLFLAGGAFFDPKMVIHIDWRIICALLYQIVVVACFGFVIWNTFLKKYGASSLHSFNFIMPIAGVAISALLIGEAITPHLFTALILIVSGLLVIHYRPSHRG
jgi:drug/metabolite transporter (DMT)-like permease